MIEFGAWTPDQADLENPGVQNVKNVLPRTGGRGNATTYAPMSSMAEVSDAAPEQVRGAFSAKESDGTVYTFIATSDELRELSSQSWTDVSKSATPYTITAAEFAQYGDRVIGALGHADPLQSYVMGTSSIFADITGPRGKHISDVRDFIMIGDTWDSSDGSVQNRVWWSAINDPTSWPTPGSSSAIDVQSDNQILPHGGRVQRIMGGVGGVDAAIFMEKSIYRATYEGSPSFFRFDELERDRGALSARSCVNVGKFGFYLGEEGFYIFDGTRSTPIGDQRIDKTFFAELEESYVENVIGAGDPINKMVIWIYPGPNSIGGMPNKALVYNWSVDRWSQGEITSEFIFRDFAQGVTLDNLDAYGNMDTLPASLDSRAWQGGSLLLGLFSSDHKLARLTGSNMEATIETPEFGGERFFVNGVRPYVDGGTVTVRLRTRDTPGGSKSATTYRSVDADGMAHFTTSARYGAAEIKVAAGGSWTHAQGIDMDMQKDGGL